MKKNLRSAKTPINIETKKLNPSEILRKKHILIKINISIRLLRINSMVIIPFDTEAKMVNKFNRIKKKSKKFQVSYKYSSPYIIKVVISYFMKYD
jgi:hypothetical protein